MHHPLLTNGSLHIMLGKLELGQSAPCVEDEEVENSRLLRQAPRDGLYIVKVRQIQNLVGQITLGGHC